MNFLNISIKMIKFFRKIRQKLLTENRLNKYLLYAIGEIILVVIGILIALQVSNWNQNRLDNIERKEIIKNLHNEFIQNKKQISNILKSYKRAKGSSLELLKYIGTQEKVLSNKRTIDSLFDRMFTAVDYSPSNNVINEIISSGKLNSLKNEIILEKLYDWQNIIYICLSREEKNERWVFEELIPYTNSYISWRDIGVASNYSWSTKGKIATNYIYIFNDLKFENILENYIYFLDQSEKRYKEALVLIDEIIKITIENN